jgi:hypothetical protein
MPKAHRHADSRVCGASTIVVGQTSVKVNGRLWAVKDDPNSHGGGELIPSFNSVTIAGKRVIVHTPDQAKIDGFDHVGMADATSGHSGSVSAYG